jgi:hypothetical protein
MTYLEENDELIGPPTRPFTAVTQVMINHTHHGLKLGDQLPSEVSISTRMMLHEVFT